MISRAVGLGFGRGCAICGRCDECRRHLGRRLARSSLSCMQILGFWSRMLWKVARILERCGSICSARRDLSSTGFVLQLDNQTWALNFVVGRLGHLFILI